MQAQRLKSILSTVHQRNSIVDSESSSSIGTKLAIWNDETEEYLVTGNNNSDNPDDPLSIKEAARLLHSILVVFMVNDDPLQVNTLRERSGDKNVDAY